MPLPAGAASAIRTTPLQKLRPATLLAFGLLAVVSCYLVPLGALAGGALVVFGLLAASGLSPLAWLRTLRPFTPVALLVLVLHVVTATDAAPLGRPSWLGLERGLAILARVALSLACVVLWRRTVSLSSLIAGLGWWLRPWRRFGADPARLGLILSVALGAVPRTLAEGRRIAAVQRLRRTWRPAASAPATATAPPTIHRASRWQRTLDRVHVVAPLIEGIFRRGDALAISLAGRRIRVMREGVAPRPREIVGLLAWIGALVVAVTGAGEFGLGV